jgi:hypothetical protein
MKVSGGQDAQGRGKAGDPKLVARLRPSRRHPDGLPRCQRVRLRDGQWHQCRRAAREGFRVCGIHGAGYAVREKAGTKKNPALARLNTGKYAKLTTLEALAASDDRAFFALAMRQLRVEIDRMAAALVPA